jgi:hypothetical protein
MRRLANQRRLAVLLAGVGMAAAAALPAQANQINTGGSTGSYALTFCPLVEKALKDNKFDYVCTPSEGSRENIQRSIADPTQIGFSQLDVFALEKNRLGDQKLLTAMRSDIGRECLFMVTGNKQLNSFGQIAAAASQLRFVLPPAKSGSSATFEYLQQVDPQGLGLAQDVTYVESADAAITQAMASDDMVTLLVQFPDPSNARFKAITAGGGTIVPVIDRTILRQEFGGEKVYYAEETDITPPKWLKTVPKLITACTPMVLITGTPDRLPDGTAQRDQQDLIRTMQALPVDQLRPKQGFFKTLWNKTKTLSAQSIEKMVVLSEEAREKAKPMLDDAIEKTKEMTEQAKQQAKDLLKKAQDATSGTTPKTP